MATLVPARNLYAKIVRGNATLTMVLAGQVAEKPFATTAGRHLRANVKLEDVKLVLLNTIAQIVTFVLDTEISTNECSLFHFLSRKYVEDPDSFASQGALPGVQYHVSRHTLRAYDFSQTTYGVCAIYSLFWAVPLYPDFQNDPQST